jgi:hypothetical protein
VTKGDATRGAERYHEKDEKIIVDEEEARKRSEKDRQARKHRTSQGLFPILLFLVHRGKEICLYVC